MPRALAYQDTDEAIAFYLNEQAHQAALGFIDALENAYQHISRFPATGSLRYAFELDVPNLRAWPLSRYPYTVFYIENAKHIDVWRVLQNQRDIAAWMQAPAQG